MVNHDRTGIFRWLSFVLATVGVPLSAHAYEPTQTMDGKLVRWFVRFEPIPFHTAVVPAHAHIPAVDFPALVQAAYDQWRARAPCATVPEFVHAGTTDDTSPTWPEDLSDTDNLVVFITSADEWDALGQSSTVLASTFARYVAATGELFEADIAINAAAHVFSVDDTGPEGTRDLLTVIQHETGHALGLAHSENVKAAMHAGYPEPAGDDPLPGRTLTKDDLNGICASYSDVPVHVPPDVMPSAETSPSEIEPADAAETPPTETEPADATETSPSETEPADAAETSPPETEPADAIETSPPEGVAVEATTPDASAAETVQGGNDSGCAGGLAAGDGNVAIVLLCGWLCLGWRRRSGGTSQA